MSAARPSTVPPAAPPPLGLLMAPLLIEPALGLLIDPLLMAPLPAAEGAIAAVVGMPAGAGAWPAWFASYGTAAVLHADSIPAAPRTPAPSSTQRRVAQ
jgi:hypothetical protein